MLKVKRSLKETPIYYFVFFLVAGICAQGPHRGHHCCQVHPVELRVLCQEWAGNQAVGLTLGETGFTKWYSKIRLPWELDWLEKEDVAKFFSLGLSVFTQWWLQSIVGIKY